MTKITIKSHVDAEIANVWDSYTDPKHIVKWNFASDDWCCPHAENDMNVGGKYKARMEAKDKSFGFDFEAIYTEVTYQESFTYVMEDGRNVHVTFEDLNGKTNVTVIFDAEEINPIDMQQNGWQAILDNFKSYAEKH